MQGAGLFVSASAARNVVSGWTRPPSPRRWTADRRRATGPTRQGPSVFGRNVAGNKELRSNADSRQLNQTMRAQGAGAMKSAVRRSKAVPCAIQGIVDEARGSGHATMGAVAVGSSNSKNARPHPQQRRRRGTGSAGAWLTPPRVPSRLGQVAWSKSLLIPTGPSGRRAAAQSGPQLVVEQRCRKSLCRICAPSMPHFRHSPPRSLVAAISFPFKHCNGGL